MIRRGSRVQSSCDGAAQVLRAGGRRQHSVQGRAR